MIVLNERGQVLAINSDRIAEYDDKKYIVLDIYRNKKKVLDKVADRIREDSQEEKKSRSL